MVQVINASTHTLAKSISLLQQLKDEQLSNNTIPPYYSCIGAHIRHILDFYNCILFDLSKDRIDLTKRERDERMNCDCLYSIEKIENTISKLNSIDLSKVKSNYLVVDDLGLGKIEMNYTFEAALSQANSHAIHHYAIINYILDKLGVQFEDSDFGYNPTSPKNKPVISSN